MQLPLVAMVLREASALMRISSIIIYIRPKKHLKMNKEVRMLLPKKELIQVE